LKEIPLQGYIDKIQKSIKGQRVLDVGCCATYERNNLKRHLLYKRTAGKIIGLDIHTEFLKLGMQQHQVELYNCDITDKMKVGQLVPVLGQFDHVIATDIVEHIGNSQLLFDNLHLFMTPDASLYLTTPNVRSPWWLGIWHGHIKRKVNEDHHCWFDIDTLNVMLKASGLEVSEHFYCTHDLDRKAAKRLKLEWQPWMGRRLYVVARKVK
jgi:2-polyprenyl-3-methyl-5-hydroxy-6-metoxy-1,4-benzoquinol methylase